MSDAELIALVREMRAAQKAYFKTRNLEHLTTSKRLEREIDKALEARAAGQGVLV
jgi:hypothetical protein